MENHTLNNSSEEKMSGKDYFVLSDKKRHISFDVKDEPERLHIVKSGFDNMYFVFWENAYETEPGMSGISFMNKEQILSKFDLDITGYL